MVEIVENRYGKSRVRLVKVSRHNGHHDMHEWTVEVLLEGDFDSSYSEGDNTRVLPTDTMKNTVYSRARVSEASTPEAFALELADFFLSRNAPVSAVRIKVESTLWKRLTVDGKPHADSFMRGSAERQVTRVRMGPEEAASVASGFEDLVLMKTAHSGFSGFVRDSLTTLPETSDRLLATAVSAEWTYSAGFMGGDAEFRAQRGTVREAMLKAFAGHHSLSVQHTLYAMAEAALAASPEIEEVHLVMPNKHCLLVDLGRFGQDNPNEIFVPTDEPHGTIEARIRRAR